ncbi:MAG: isochorismatase family protein [Gammaproteobacteria bacterium]
MNDWRGKTLAEYQQKGFAGRSGFGARPALLIVDFINGFTDPKSPLGGDFTPELEVTQRLLDAFRHARLPIAYTTIAYEPDLRDGGLFVKKVPSLAILQKGSRQVEIDRRIRPRFDEYIAEKKFASAFFGTELDGYLKGLGVDTIVMTGCTTSGCIRASAIDSMQYGYHTVVVSDGVGDRAQGPHEANLFDIDAKYGDVMPAQAALDYLSTGVDRDDQRGYPAFQRWWNADSQAR